MFLKRPRRSRLLGGRLRRLSCTVSRPRTVVSEPSSTLSSAARAVVEPPRPTAALRTDLPEPSESRSEAGGVPGLEGAHAPRRSCARRLARGRAASLAPWRSRAHGPRDLRAWRGPALHGARCCSSRGSWPSPSGGGAARLWRSARCAGSTARGTRLHIVLDEHARRFGVGRPAVARVAGRTSRTLQPSLGRDPGSTAPDSSGTAELTEALHRQRGGIGCANGITVDNSAVTCSQISVVERRLAASAGSSDEPGGGAGSTMVKERRDDVDVQNGIDTWLRRAGLPTTHALQGAFAPLCCRVDRSVWASCVCVGRVADLGLAVAGQADGVSGHRHGAPARS